MNLRIGYIPYLNMAPFHQGFGPEPLEVAPRRFEFHALSPRALGQSAEKGMIDAGAFSLVDAIRLSDHYEPVGQLGIGVHRAAQSVLLFSRAPFARLSGATVSVTDETSTSFRLLQALLEMRYELKGIRYGRIASSMLFDGQSDALLLIGDEALRAKKEGVTGFPIVTDLGEEWFSWQRVPFVFARWMVRQALRQEVKDVIETQLEKSLRIVEADSALIALRHASARLLMPQEVDAYWRGFAYRLTADHFTSIDRFASLLEKLCLTA
jgi:chorismate dehydratase